MNSGGGRVGEAAAAHLEAPDDHQRVDVEPGDVLADFLQHFSRQRSSHRKRQKKTIKCDETLQEKQQ